TGSREENASKQEIDLPFRFNRNGRGCSRHCCSVRNSPGNRLCCGREPTRVQNVFFEDRVSSVDFDERHVIAPKIGEVLKNALRIRLVQLGSLHDGMAQHQATIARKVNIDYFDVGIDEPDVVLPCQFTTNTTIAAFVMDSIYSDTCAFRRIVMQMEH